MKRRLLTTLLTTAIMTSSAQVTPVSQMEKLDRGLIALPSNTGMGNFVSWRFLGTDAANTRFDLIRDGITVANNLAVTNYEDWDWNWDDSVEHQYQVVTKVDGEVIETTGAVKPWTTIYKKLKLQRPAARKTKPYSTTNTINKEKVTENYPNGQDYSYSPNDCSVGDVDGDGQYELFVKWDPSNSRDNSHNGVTGNVIIDCYRLDGTLLWRVDLGSNIRAGAHYTQFQVYDYDGDGRAEMMCKTAPGSLDGKGNYVNQAATDARIKAASNTKDWGNGNAGRIDGGQEYLTVFNGETGEAIHTIAYFPNRNAKAELSEAAGTFNWGGSNKTDKGSYGNRGERYLAATAFLDGPDHTPSGIFCRGYYTFAYIWAVDFDGTQLKHRWLHRSDSETQWSVVDASMKESAKITAPKASSGKGSNTMYGNGNHNLSIGDVDGDGKDEIIWGSAACDDNGRLLYATGFGHGDAIHLADLDPDRPGLELFEVHEEKGTYAWDIHDAATGEILWKGGMKGADNGRGLAADIVSSNRGQEFWSSERGPEGIEYDKEKRDQRPYNAITNTPAGTQKPSMNFRIYWDGDLLDELLDGTTISKYGGSTLGVNGTPIGNLGSPSSCNGTKATPCLLADLFGDWREEVILWSTSDNATLNIYTTTTATEYRVPTLMHDHTYRMGIAWQNTAYNQPPHLGYYLPDYIDGKLTSSLSAVTTQTSLKREVYDLQGRKQHNLKRGLNIIREDGRTRKVFVE